MALVSTMTYDAKYTSEWYTSLVLNVNSLSNVSVITPVNGAYRIPSAGYSLNPLQADSCAWTDSGDLTVSDKKITPEILKINSSLCKQTLESTFVVESMRAAANKREIPADVNDFMLKIMKNNVGAQIERLFWNGDKAAGSNNLIDGILKKGSASASTVKVTATTVTAANVIAELDKVFLAIPDAVLFSSEPVKIYVSTTIAKLYKQALAALNRSFSPTATYELQFQGIELVVAPFANANRMVAAVPSNLVFSTNFEINDGIQIIDQAAISGSDEVRFKTRLVLAADFKTDSEVVIYA